MATMTQPTSGWYPDPAGPGMRYFDGVHWTEHETAGPEWRNAARYQAPPNTVVVQGPNHALHAILTIFTCGLWAPVWIIVTIAGSKVRVTR